ncbi:MAG: MerR family transcriptional regulator [Thermomicrobiales bacterium]
MTSQHSTDVIRVSLTDWLTDEDEPGTQPKYAMSLVAARSGLGRTTLLRYEEWGVVNPSRSGRDRLYSEADLDRLMRAQRLIDDLGVNIAGAAAVLQMREQIIALQRELMALRGQSDR